MKKNKVILQLTGMDSTHYGAKERYFIEFANQCQSKGYKCVLQYESQPGSTDFVKDLKSTGADFVVLATRSKPLKAIYNVIKLIGSTRPEIIETHFVNKYIRSITPMVAKTFRVRKSIAFVRNMPYRKNVPLRRLMYIGYDHVYAVSNAITDYLVNDLGLDSEFVSTHYWGVLGIENKSEQLRTQYRKELKIPEEATVIGIIAFDTRFKGLDILLAAFAKVRKKYHGVRLLLIGIDPSSFSLSQQVEKLGIAEYIHWAGIRDQGWRTLNAADIYIQPSRDSEGVPVAMLEAMALKLPAIGTRVGGIPEAIVDHETGLLAKPNSVKSIVHALDVMIEDPTRLKAMGEAGYERYLKLFNGKESIKRLLGFYLQ
ncbi:MAG: glycosyltransferase family 4 protein [Bacteroidetes bacterium]|nr:glycosyltransferase family 4 protein [Bacteroidota bacterium]